MLKQVRTPTYNYDFDVSNGYMQRWGSTIEDDPQYSPIGAEILDIEVSTICHQGCAFCYKNNKGQGINMTFDTFKMIVDKMPTLQQIAFGIGDIDTNPDLFRMFEYCRNKNIVPNVTINGSRMTPYYFDLLAKYCGAVAVSLYDIDKTLLAVKELTDRGMTQINIHALLSLENLPKLNQLVRLMREGDVRLAKLNAVVFLSLKPKGRGINSTPLTQEEYNEFIGSTKGLRIGFDSCSAHKFLNSLTEEEKKTMEVFVEPCESGLFSSYIDVNGVYYPCSFATGLQQGIPINSGTDFLQDVWYNPLTVAWRKNLIQAKRNCPLYSI